jgi:2-polyprenyl-3-methyl-5-hydroxy-6-metoxy-1,4-benzoquinol methylase
MSKKHTELPACPLCCSEKRPKFLGYKLRGFQGLYPARIYNDAEKVYRCTHCYLTYTDQSAEPEKSVFDADDSLLPLTDMDLADLKESATYNDILLFLKEKARLPMGSSVLDLGSGLGRVAFNLRKAGYTAHAVEPKKELFDFAIKNGLTDAKTSYNISFEQANFEENSFDFIFLEPLNHFTNPHQALEKTLKWLKPGAYLHLEVVNSKWLYKSLLALFYKITLRKHVPFTSLHRKPFNACEYSPETFGVYCSEQGLNICYLTTYVCDTYIRNKFFNKIVGNYMWRFNKGMELTLVIQKPK